MRRFCIWSVLTVAIIVGLVGMTMAIALEPGQGDAKGNFVPGEVIVGFSKQTGISAQESVISAYGGEAVDRIDALNCVLVRVKEGKEQEFIDKISKEGNVRYAERNGIVRALYLPNDPKWGEQWGPKMINADDAWDIEKGSKNVKIAIVDTGVDYTHEDLSGNYVSGGYDWINSDSDPMDDSGHGTHCAGIAAAVMDNGKGIAGITQVGIMAEKVLNETGYGSDWTLSQGITYAANNGANIISMSLGSSSPLPTSEGACSYAWGKGCLLVAAAGNENSTDVSYPARYDTVIAVGAINEAGEKWSKSNWGPDVELVAPGNHTLSTVPGGYSYKSGTSMATPHVAGVAALIWSMYPELTNDEIRERLHNTGIHYEWDGYGLVDAMNALGDYLKISSANVSAGNVTKVQISIGNAKNITGVSLNLSYNSLVIAIQNITANATINATGNCTCDSNVTNGLARIIFLSGVPITTTSETSIIDAELKAIGSAGSFSYLNLSNVNFTNTSYELYAPSVVYNGTVNVTAPSDTIPPNVTNATANPQIIPDDTDNDPRWGENSTLNVTVTDESTIASVTINLSAIGKSANQLMTNIGDNIWSVTTNASAGTASWNGSAYVNHSLQVNATDEYGNSNTNVSINLTVIRNGDVSEDSYVDAWDCTYLARHLATIPGYGALHDEVADVSGDGIVDAWDCTYLARHLATIPGYELLK